MCLQLVLHIEGLLGGRDTATSKVVLHAVRELCGCQAHQPRNGGQVDEAEVEHNLSVIAMGVHASTTGEKSYLP